MIGFVFLHENSHFLFKIISKYIPKLINHKFFKKILHENNYYPIAIVYLKYLFFYMNMNPPNKAHGFAMRSMSLRDMQIPKSEKKNSCPPPAKSWGRP